MKISKGDKLLHTRTRVVFVVEAVHEPSRTFWGRRDEEGSQPVTYAWTDEMWEVVKPFFEEGKTYVHKRLRGRTFEVVTVRDDTAFGRITPTDGMTPEWTCRRHGDFSMWVERR